jgi:hypothetical protein
VQNAIEFTFHSPFLADFLVLFYLSDYQKDSFMIADAVERYPLDLWNWGIRNCSGHLRTLPREIVRLNLLPRKQATITPQGIRFEPELYYTHASYGAPPPGRQRANGTGRIPRRRHSRL